jgi:hypothetical protein
MLTLSDAVKSGRLQEFIKQEEARGIGPIDRADALVTKAVKAPRSEDQTSHSSSRDGSNETQTPQDTAPYASR